MDSYVVAGRVVIDPVRPDTSFYWALYFVPAARSKEEAVEQVKYKTSQEYLDMTTEYRVIGFSEMEVQK